MENIMRTPEEIEAILDKIEDFLKSYEDADNEFQTNQRKDHWKEKFGDRLGKYSDKLKTLNGDDFDVLDSSFEEYESEYPDLSDEEYVDALENNIKSTIERIWPEAPEEVKEEVAEEVVETVTEEEKPAEEAAIESVEEEKPTEEATEEKEEEPKEEKSEEPLKEEVHIEAEDKNGDGEISEDEVETHTVEETEKPSEEEKDEVAEFYKELEEYKENMPQRHKEEE